MDKQVFKQVEAVLYKYQDNLTQIKNLELELQLIKNSYTECRGIEYSDMPGVRSCNSTVENEVIKRDIEIRKIEVLLRNKKVLKQQIDNIISSLDDVDKKIVTMRYLGDYAISWKLIAKECGFSESHCRQIKRTAIVERMASGLIHKF